MPHLPISRVRHGGRSHRQPRANLTADFPHFCFLLSAFQFVPPTSSASTSSNSAAHHQSHTAAALVASAQVQNLCSTPDLASGRKPSILLPTAPAPTFGPVVRAWHSPAVPAFEVRSRTRPAAPQHNASEVPATNLHLACGSTPSTKTPARPSCPSSPSSSLRP